MSLTESTMLALETKAPEFSLPDVVSGQTVTLKNFADKKALVVMFICRHCPYVQHVQQELKRIGKDYQDKSVGIMAISSNDAEMYPEDGPERLKEMAESLSFEFPLLYDESQEVAKSYTAACTPDFFLFDENRKLVYRGQLDDSRPGHAASYASRRAGNNQPVTGKDLRGAIEAVLADREVSQDQKPASGCNIKWKPGNEPEYFK